MGTRRISYLLLVGFGALILFPRCVAQGRGGTGSQEPKQQVYADLGQIMKGIMFPASNVIFATQKQNPADVTPAKDPSTATDLLDGSYGKWEAVENSALAIAWQSSKVPSMASAWTLGSVAVVIMRRCTSETRPCGNRT